MPFEALPSVLDPKDGYVITANQAVIGKDYPYYIGDSYAYGYRAQRLRELLTAKDDLTVDDMAAIQLDNFSALAEKLTPMLLALKVPGGYYNVGQEVLRDWDYQLDATSSAAAYFNVVWNLILEKTFHDQLPKNTWPDGGSRWWQVVRSMLDDPRNAFWDDVDTSEVAETRDDILHAAQIDARDELTRTMSRDPHDWEWGRLHTLDLRNETLGTSSVGFLFNRGPYELSGGPEVVNASSWDAAEDYDATAVPSMRMVIPLDDLDGARWINLTGASGHAYDDHYTDQTDLWVNGETLPWLFSSGAVEAAADQTLTLEPAG